MRPRDALPELRPANGLGWRTNADARGVPCTKGGPHRLPMGGGERCETCKAPRPQLRQLTHPMAEPIRGEPGVGAYGRRRDGYDE